MASAIMNYPRSLSTNFGNALNPTQFQAEINADAGISPTCLAVLNEGDTVTIVFQTETSLSTAEETTLDVLISAHVPKVTIGGAVANYDALVATDGSGDFLKPSEAFAAGAVTVYVKSGTYVEFTDVVIPNYGVLVGETVAPVVLYFVGNIGVKVDGSGGVKETVGTISVANRSQAVTGTGTTFTNLSPGNFILLDQNYYQIAAIADDTNLTLVDVYNGRSLNTHEYMAQAMHTGITLSNIILYHSAGTGLYMRAVRSGVINTCGCMNNYIGLHMEDSSTNAFNIVNCFGNALYGICLSNTHSVGFINGEVYNNGSDGIEIKTHSTNVVFNGVLVANNHGAGINVQGTASKVLVNDCVIQRNNGKGINTEAGTGSAVIDGSMMLYNGDNGINFDGEGNVISNCNISHNAGHGVHAGDDGTVTGCHIYENGLHGIDMGQGQDCQITSNNIHQNTQDGININGGTCNIVQGNCLRANGGSGIAVTNGVDNNLSGNNISDNTGQGGIVLTGTSSASVISGNRIRNNAAVGIEVPATSDDTVISGNVVSGQGSHGISVAANECLVTSNRCHGNSGDGCVVSAGATSNTVKTNRFTGNTGADFTDNGTTTIKD